MTPAIEAAIAALESQLTPIRESRAKWGAKEAELRIVLLRLDNSFQGLICPLKQLGRKQLSQEATDTDNSPVIAAAKQAIERLRTPVEEKLNQVAAKVDGLRTQELPMEAAIKALEAPAKEPAKKRKKPSGSNVKQKDVIEACVKVLREEHALKAAELEQKVRLYLKKDRGLTLLGYTMRFGEAMKNDVFTIVEDGVVVLSDSVIAEESTAIVTPASEVIAN